MTDLTIVFDLDGTLVDTAPDLAATLNHVLGESVLEPVDAATIRPLIGHGARLMLKSSLERAGKAVDDDRLDRLLARYLAHYRNHLADLSRPYPGAIDALRRFREKGVRLAICTNKYESLAKRLLAELAIDRFFDAITGADTFEVRKPHPEHLTRTIALVGGTPGRAVMVGDSETDIATAKAARVPVIGVTFGYSDKPMAALGADVLIDHYDGLESAVRGLTAAYTKGYDL